MKIIFNSMNCGLGNNGGSQTIIKSANTLKKLGHEVTIVDTGKNQYTWGPTEVNHLIIKDYTQIPEADSIIATGIKTLESTDKCNIKNKYHWIRGWETWNIPEDKLVNIIKNSSSIKIVNSFCLRKKLKSFDIESYGIRPGYDFDETYPMCLRFKNKKIVIGGLFNSGKKRDGKRTEWIIKAFHQLQSIQPIELYMFGSDGKPNSNYSFFVQNPSPKQKNLIYNKCDIWLSPSELEGLHIPPAEAGLTQCCVITTDAEMSGTQDYIIDKETGLVSKNDFDSFLTSIEEAIIDKDLRYELGKNLWNKILELGSREDNMKRLVTLLEELNK